MEIKQLEQSLLAYIEALDISDPAHDTNHVLRVVKSAKALCEKENADRNIVIPAAYLHDCFTFPKNHPDRAQSSKIAADKAVTFLESIHYPEQHLDAIHHAIVAHSFSANIPPQTLEAKIIQDADRLDALGAIGIVRWMQVTSKLGTRLYNENDPMCANREPDDRQFAIDHYYVKLLNLVETMNTDSARKEAQTRTDFMKSFLNQFEHEV